MDDKEESDAVTMIKFEATLIIFDRSPLDEDSQKRETRKHLIFLLIAYLVSVFIFLDTNYCFRLFQYSIFACVVFYSIINTTSFILNKVVYRLLKSVFMHLACLLFIVILHEVYESYVLMFDEYNGWFFLLKFLVCLVKDNSNHPDVYHTDHTHSHVVLRPTISTIV